MGTDVVVHRLLKNCMGEDLGVSAYEPLPGYDYRGRTHVSIGQEASAVGASSVLRITDNVTSSHRRHGDAIAKGFSALRQMTGEQLRARTGAPGDAARSGSGPPAPPRRPRRA